MIALAVGAVFVLFFFGWRISQPKKPAPKRIGMDYRCVPKVGFKATERSYLVVGGHGFLGSHVVEGLLARGEKKICIFDQNDSNLFDPEKEFVKFIKGNILDPQQLYEACKGKDTVFHTAALVDYWSRLPFQFQKCYDVNVKGTINVIEACKKAGVRRLVYVSSGSVVLQSDLMKKPMDRINETVSYSAPPYLNHYVHTKALAEKEVLKAATKETDSKGLLTVAIRPGGIWGPRDVHILKPFLSDAYPAIGLRTKSGCDYNYVGNVAHALFCAEDSLKDASSPANGSAYFITDENPAPTDYEWNSRIAKVLDCKFELIPAIVVTFLACSSEFLVRVTRGKITPYLGDLAFLTPAVLTISRGLWTVDDRRARAEIGWSPLFKIEECLDIALKYKKSVVASQKEEKKNV